MAYDVGQGMPRLALWQPPPIANTAPSDVSGALPYLPSDFEQPPASAGPSNPSELGRSITSSLRNFGSTVPILAGAYGNLVSPGMGDDLLRYGAGMRRQAIEEGPSIQDLKQVHGVGDALQWAGNQAIGLAPDVALAALTGGVGEGVVRGAAGAAAKRLAASEAGQAVARRTAANVGADFASAGVKDLAAQGGHAVEDVASTLGPSMAANAAEDVLPAVTSRAADIINRRAQANAATAAAGARLAGTGAGFYPSTLASMAEGTTDANGNRVGGLEGADRGDTLKYLVGAAPAALLGALPEFRALGHLTAPIVKGVAEASGDAAAKGAQAAITADTQRFLPALLSRAGKIGQETAIQGGLGAGAGVLQTAATLATHKWVNDNVSLMSQPAFDAYINSAISGGALGAAVGAGIEGVRSAIHGTASATPAVGRVLNEGLAKFAEYRELALEKYRKMRGDAGATASDSTTPPPGGGPGGGGAAAADEAPAETPLFNAAAHYMDTLKSQRGDFEQGEADAAVPAPRAPSQNPAKLGSPMQDMLATFLPANHPIWAFPEVLKPMMKSVETIMGFGGDAEPTPADFQRMDNLKKYAPQVVERWEAAAAELRARGGLTKTIEAHPDTMSEADHAAATQAQAAQSVGDEAAPGQAPADTVAGMHAETAPAGNPLAAARQQLQNTPVGHPDFGAAQQAFRDQLLGGNNAFVAHEGVKNSEGRLDAKLAGTGGTVEAHPTVAPIDPRETQYQQQAAAMAGKSPDTVAPARWDMKGKRLGVELGNLMLQHRAQTREPISDRDALLGALGDLHMAGVSIKPSSIKEGPIHALGPDGKPTDKVIGSLSADDVKHVRGVIRQQVAEAKARAREPMSAQQLADNAEIQKRANAKAPTAGQRIERVMDQHISAKERAEVASEGFDQQATSGEPAGSHQLVERTPPPDSSEGDAFVHHINASDPYAKITAEARRLQEGRHAAPPFPKAEPQPPRSPYSHGEPAHISEARERLADHAEHVKRTRELIAEAKGMPDPHVGAEEGVGPYGEPNLESKVYPTKAEAEKNSWTKVKSLADHVTEQRGQVERGRDLRAEDRKLVTEHERDARVPAHVEAEYERGMAKYAREKAAYDKAKAAHEAAHHSTMTPGERRARLHELGVQIGTRELTKQRDNGAISDRTFGIMMKRLANPETGVARKYLTDAATTTKYVKAKVSEHSVTDEATPTGEDKRAEREAEKRHQEEVAAGVRESDLPQGKEMPAAEDIQAGVAKRNADTAQDDFNMRRRAQLEALEKQGKLRPHEAAQLDRMRARDKLTPAEKKSSPDSQPLNNATAAGGIPPRPHVPVIPKDAIDHIPAGDRPAVERLLASIEANKNSRFGLAVVAARVDAMQHLDPKSRALLRDTIKTHEFNTNWRLRTGSAYSNQHDTHNVGLHVSREQYTKVHGLLDEVSKAGGTMHHVLQTLLPHMTAREAGIARVLIKSGALKDTDFSYRTRAALSPHDVMDMGGGFSSDRNHVGLEGLEPTQSNVAINPMRTVLHESAHAATVSQEASNPVFRARLRELYDAAKTHADSAPGFSSKHYAFGDTQEFIAEAFGNKVFQDFLKTAPSVKGGSLWTRFVDTVANVLGLKRPEQRTLLTDILEAGATAAGDRGRELAGERSQAPAGDHTLYSPNAVHGNRLSIDELKKVVHEKLSPDARMSLERALTSGAGTQRLMRAYEHDPAARKAMLDAKEGLENRIAYAYKAYHDGRLKVGDRTLTVFNGLKDNLLNVAGLAGDSQFARRTLEDIGTGRVEREGMAYSPHDIEAQLRGKPQQALNAGTRVYFRAMAPLKRVFQSSVERMHATGIPALRSLASQLHVHTGEASEKRGLISAVTHTSDMFLRKFEDVIGDLSPREQMHLMQAMQEGRGRIAGNNPRVEAAVQRMRGIMDHADRYAKPLGMKRMENYFPVIMDIRNGDDAARLKTLLSDPQFATGIRDAMGGDQRTPLPTLIDRMVETARKNSPENSQPYSGDPVQPGFRHASQRFMQFIYDHGTTDQIKEFAKLQTKSPADVASRYFLPLVKSTESARRFGVNDEGLNKTLDTARSQGATDAQIEHAKYAVDAARGRIGMDGSPILKKFLPESIANKVATPGVRKAVALTQAYQNARLLPLALISSLVDPMGIAVRTGGDFKTSWNGFKVGIKSLYDKNTRADLHNMLRDLGSTEDYLTSEMLNNGYGSGMADNGVRKFNDALFKWNGLAGWTRATRYMALQAAHGFLLKHAAADTLTSQRYMDELGLRKGDIQAADGKVRVLSEAERAAASPDEKARDNRVRTGLMRFVDEAILRPNSQMSPAWMADPYLGLLSQYKAFAYAVYDQIGQRISHEINHGNLRVLLPAMSYLPVIIASEMLRGLIQYGPGGNPQRDDWGPTDYAKFSLEKSGLLGPEKTFGAETALNKNQEFPGAAFAGPTAQQAYEVGHTALGHGSVGHTVERALPGEALYSHWR